MLKKFLKKITRDFMLSLSCFALCVIAVSVFPPMQRLCAEHRLDMYEKLIDFGKAYIIVALVISVLEFLIIKLELITKNKWINRVIYIIVMAFIGFIFMYIESKKFISVSMNNLDMVIIIVSILIAIVLSVILYFIEDKRHKKDILIINEILKDISEQ